LQVDKAGAYNPVTTYTKLAQFPAKPQTWKSNVGRISPTP